MKWLDPRVHAQVDKNFIAYIVKDREFSYVTVGYIENNYFFDLLSKEIFYDVSRDEDDQFEKLPLSYLKAWMPLPEPPINIYGEINAVHPSMTYDEKSKMLTVKEGNDIIYSVNVEGKSMMEFCLIAQEAYRKYKENKDNENNG